MGGVILSRDGDCTLAIHCGPDVSISQIRDNAGRLPIQLASSAGTDWLVIISSRNCIFSMVVDLSPSIWPAGLGLPFKLFSFCWNKMSTVTIHLALRGECALSVINYLLQQDPATLMVPESSGGLFAHLACSTGVDLPVIALSVNRGGAGTLSVRNGSGSLPLHLLC